MINYKGVFSGSDGSSEVKFSIEGDLTDEKVVDALDKIGYIMNKSYHTSAVLASCDTSRVDVEWDNGDSLSAFAEIFRPVLPRK